MRAFILALCSIAIAGAETLRSQSPQQPVFRGGVELVTLDVTVVDKDGRPVKGLKPEDFAVLLEGQARPVRALDFLEFGASGGSDAAPARETTNQPGQAAPAKRGGRVIVILFDDLSYKAGPGKSLTEAALRLLPTFDLDDQIGLATTSGLGPIVNPTRDRAAIAATLKDKKLVGRDDDTAAPFFIGVDEALDIERGVPTDTLPRVIARECAIVMPAPGGRGNKAASGEIQGDTEVCPHMVEAAARRVAQATLHRTAMQMQAYQEVIKALKPAPAPRVIIALSAGVATGSTHLELTDQLAPLGRAASEAGVEFYALTDVPDAAGAEDVTGDRAQARQTEGRYLNAGIQTVASAAGGEAFLVVGTADRFYRRIEAETSGFYRLGVEAPLGTDKARFVKAKVSVKQSGVTVRTHAQALVATVAAQPVSIDDQLKTTLAQGGASFGVPIALATALRRSLTAAGSLELGVNVEVPAVVAAPLVAMYALVNESGKTLQQARREIPPGAPNADYQLAFPVRLEPGNYRLRFAVADANGNVGSLEHRVVANLAHMGAFSVSEFFMTWAGADGAPRFLALETLPGSAQTFRATLELYPDNAAAPPADVTVRLAVLRAGEDTPLVEHDLTPVANAGAAGLVVSAEMPVEMLEPGTYTVRATLLESGAVMGTVTSAIRKKAPGGF
jgi:VWFA-related protein